MFLIAAALCLVVLILAGAADLLQAQYNPDELSKMGVHER